MSADCEQKYENKTWLREQYIDEEKTLSQIADMCNCCIATISRRLKAYNVPTRGRGVVDVDQRLDDEQWLRERYVCEKRSYKQMSEMCDCSPTTVKRKLKKYDIPTRNNRHLSDHRLQDEQWLREKYIEETKSSEEISEICDCAPSTVRRHLKKANIETRPASPRSGKDHPHWEEDSSPYGSGWTKRKRERVRELDNYQCIDCGMIQKNHKLEYDCRLHVHHLLKARDVDDGEKQNAVDNLVTLCVSCHRKWEQMSKMRLKPEIDRDG
jgi:AraC-like DNA-binding protein